MVILGRTRFFLYAGRESPFMAGIGIARMMNSHSYGLIRPFRVISGWLLSPCEQGFAGRKLGKVYIPSVCLCARGYQRKICARRVGKFIYVVEKVFYRLGPPDRVGSTRKDHRITPDHWARTRALVKSMAPSRGYVGWCIRTQTSQNAL